METPHHVPRIPLWHSLLYSTGYLVLMPCIPAFIITGLLTLAAPTWLDRGYALAHMAAFGAGLLVGAASLGAAKLTTYLGRIHRGGTGDA
jgi:hypothetical protein